MIGKGEKRNEKGREGIEKWKRKVRKGKNRKGMERKGKG